MRQKAHEYHELAGAMALGLVALGIVFASLMYLYRVLDPDEALQQAAGLHTFLSHKWYFDELYSVAVVRPALAVSHAFKWFDLTVIDGIIHGIARLTVRISRWDGRFDNLVVDGAVNLVGNVTYRVGSSFREVQTGSLRNYVLFLALAAAGLFVVLSYFVTMVWRGEITLAGSGRRAYFPPRPDSGGEGSGGEGPWKAHNPSPPTPLPGVPGRGEN